MHKLSVTSKERSKKEDKSFCLYSFLLLFLKKLVLGFLVLIVSICF